MALLQFLQAFEEVGARFAHLLAEVDLVRHLHHLQAQRGAQRVGGEGGMRRSRREHGRVDEFFARPQAR
ncbi:hypothetical protein SDC9_54886 [bioreactor metagenome]|uniref:Uncharacterized protein n=1 Tax=bioreactor metagenome TaxID=1076179 RepID=A0A644X2Q5_9ZZZZ